MSFTLRKKPGNYSSKKSHGKQDIKFRDYQLDAIKFGLQRGAAGFFLAPGLGKTLITLYIFKILKKMGLVDELWILGKRRIIYNVWRQEIKKWKFNFKSRIIHGPHKLDELLAPADVRLMNYEGLPWLVKNKKHLRGKKLMLACDESSKLRHTRTMRFRSIKKILGLFNRRYILTGSPAPKGLMGLFGQAMVLDLGETFGTKLTTFRNKYFSPTGFRGKEWVLNKGAEKKIFKKLRPMVIRFGTDRLKLPPLTFINRWVELPETARAVYDEMEAEYITRVENQEITAANAAVASGKLRQIANGGIYYKVIDQAFKLGKIGTKKTMSIQSYLQMMMDAGHEVKMKRKWKTVHDEKIEDLVELLEELQGEPALLAYEFGHDILRIQNYFKKNAPQFKNTPFIGSSTKEAEMEAIMEGWNDGEYPLVGGHPESVAHGLNLQGKGGIVIFFSMTWNFENYEQFFQRVWRQGQKRRVLVYRILARDTVDEDMVATLRMDNRNQQRLLQAMEKRHGIR